MRIFYWFIVRQLWREPLRSCATVAGIVVGIAVVIAIQLANASSVLGFRAALDAVSGRTSLEIIGPGVGVTEDKLEELGWLREFGLVSPVIDGEALLYSKDSNVVEAELVRVLGVDILRDRPFREYSLVDDGQPLVFTTNEFLSLLTNPQSIVLTQEFANRHGLSLDSNVEMFVGDRLVSFVVRGLLGSEGPALVLDGNFVLMDIAAAQLVLDRFGRVDRLDVQLFEDSSILEVEQEISERLPEGLSVQRPERRGTQVEKMLQAFHFNLTALSYIALIVGLFMVYNTVSVSVISRRSEIGMLRTVGLSRLTVLKLFLYEAISLATVGCVFGAPLGWLLAQVAVRMTSSTVTTFWIASAAQVPPLDISYMVLAFAIGIGLAVVAAIVPALEAARLSPVATVRSERDIGLRVRLPRRYLNGAVILFILAAFFSTRSAIGGLPIFGLLSVLAIVFGAVLLVVPMLYVLKLNPDSRLGKFYIESFIARANLGISIRRLAISVGALAVSLAMMVAIAIMIGSFRETVSYWVTQTLKADLFIAPARQSSVGDRMTISSEVEEVIQGNQAVVAIDGFRSVDVSHEDSLVIIGSGRFDVLAKHGNLLFKDPINGQVAIATAVKESGVLVSESFSLKFGKIVGDEIELLTNRGLRSFLVAGVYYDYSNDRGMIVMNEQLFSHYYDDRRPSRLNAYLSTTANPDLIREEVLATLGPDRAVFINTNENLRRQVLQVFDSTFAITYALEVIAIFVAMFGVAVTLLTLTLERWRQIAMLKLIGVDGLRLRRIITIEALLIGFVSLLIGLLVGLVLSLILIYVINVQSFGWTIQFHLPIVFLIHLSLFILLGTILAGLYPARLARRFTMSTLSSEG